MQERKGALYRISFYSGCDDSSLGGDGYTSLDFASNTALEPTDAVLVLRRALANCPDNYNDTDFIVSLIRSNIDLFVSHDIRHPSQIYEFLPTEGRVIHHIRRYDLEQFYPIYEDKNFTFLEFMSEYC